jgi:hypothetical protein
MCAPCAYDDPIDICQFKIRLLRQILKVGPSISMSILTSENRNSLRSLIYQEERWLELREKERMKTIDG